jgi:hypothetical protein
MVRLLAEGLSGRIRYWDALSDAIQEQINFARKQAAEAQIRVAMRTGTASFVSAV